MTTASEELVVPNNLYEVIMKIFNKEWYSFPSKLYDYIDADYFDNSLFTYSCFVSPSSNEPSGKIIKELYHCISKTFLEKRNWLNSKDLNYYLNKKGVSLDELFKWNYDLDDDTNQLLCNEDDIRIIEITNDLDALFLSFCFLMEDYKLSFQQLSSLLENWSFIREDEISGTQLVICRKVDSHVLFSTEEKQNAIDTKIDINTHINSAKNNNESETNNSSQKISVLQKVIDYDLLKVDQIILSRAKLILLSNKLHNVVITDEQIMAGCYGSNGEDYFVNIYNKNGKFFTSCTCPSYFNGLNYGNTHINAVCKHIIAVILYVKNHSNSHSNINTSNNNQSFKTETKTSSKESIQSQVKELENKRTILYHKRQPIGKYIAIIAVSGSVAYILLMSITMWFIFGKPGVFVSILFFSGAIAGFVAVALNNSKLKEAKSHNANISRQISDINKEIDDLKKKTN